VRASEGQKPLTSCQRCCSFRLEKQGSGKESVGEGHQVGVLEIRWERNVENCAASRDRRQAATPGRSTLLIPWGQGSDASSTSSPSILGRISSGCKGVQGGAWVIRGRGQSKRTWGGKRKSYLFKPEKRNLLVVLCMRCRRTCGQIAEVA